MSVRTGMNISFFPFSSLAPSPSLERSFPFFSSGHFNDATGDLGYLGQYFSAIPVCDK